MSDIFGTIGSVNDSIISGANLGMQIDAHSGNKKDRQWAKEFAENERDYVREMNTLLLEREDTSVRRRVEDLVAAGLSPVLAAGSGAGAGHPMGSPHPSPHPLHAPQMREGMFMAMAKQYQEIKLLQAEERKRNIEADSIERDTSRKEETHPKQMQQMDYDLLERKFNIDNQSLRRTMIHLEIDKQYQDLELGDRQKIAAIYAIAQQDLNLSIEHRTHMLERLTGISKVASSVVTRLYDALLMGNDVLMRNVMDEIEAIPVLGPAAAGILRPIFESTLLDRRSYLPDIPDRPRNR